MEKRKTVLMEVSLPDIYKDCPLVAGVTYMVGRDLFFMIYARWYTLMDGALYLSYFLFVKKILY